MKKTLFILFLSLFVLMSVFSVSSVTYNSSVWNSSSRNTDGGNYGVDFTPNFNMTLTGVSNFNADEDTWIIRLKNIGDGVLDSSTFVDGLASFNYSLIGGVTYKFVITPASPYNTNKYILPSYPIVTFIGNFSSFIEGYDGGVKNIYVSYEEEAEPSGSIDVKLDYPIDSFYTNDSVVSMSCNSTGSNINVKNLTIVFIGVGYNFTNTTSGSFISYTSDFNFSNDNWSWTCEARSNNNSIWYASENRTFQVNYTPPIYSYYFQEYANQTIILGNDSEWSGVNDGSIVSYVGNVNATYLVNYSKAGFDWASYNDSVLSSWLQVGEDTPNVNLTIPLDCWRNILEFKYSFIDDLNNPTENSIRIFCYNGSNWKVLLNDSQYDAFLYEEAFIFIEEIPEEPEQENNETIIPPTYLDSDLYKVMEGSGSGLAIFMNYVSMAIFPLLFILAIVFLIIAIISIVKDFLPTRK